MDKVPVDSATTGRLGVVEAGPGQYAEIRRLLRAAYGAYEETVAPEVFPVYLADVLDLTADGATVLVAFDAGAVMGTARLHLRPTGVDLPAGAAYVRGVAVWPDREGGGIARALMATCADRARVAGATCLYLHTTSFMARAIRLYEQLGYRRAPEYDTDSSKHYGLTVQPPLRALAYRLDQLNTWEGRTMSALPAGISRKMSAAAAAVTVMTGLALVADPGTATAQPIECDDTVTGEPDFYDTPRASDTYDNLFDNSWHVPHLATHIPQGTATWSNWDGEDDLILVASYDKLGRTPSVINGIDAQTGRNVGFARIDYSHVGGIAVFEQAGQAGWAYISGPTERSVRKYSLPKLKEAIKSTEEGLLQPEGEDQTVFGNSFLTSHGPSNTLWAGTFSPFTRSHMRSYTVTANGDLEERPGVWEVPMKTQGLVVTEDLFIYSTSHGRDNRSNIYVVRRGDGSSSLDTARLYCFRAPSMSEGLTVYGSDVYVAYESGADFYSQDEDKPDNIITNLHRAPLASLDFLAPR